MGLFSKKKKVSVSTTVMRMVEDDQLPHSAKVGVLRGILKDSGVAENLVESLAESPGLKVHRMYDYARRHYTNGLPKGTAIDAGDSTDIIHGFLEAQLQRPVTLDYCYYMSLNASHVGWQVLYGQYGYDAVSNEIRELSAVQGVPVYLKDMVAVYTQEAFDTADPGSLDPVGPPATSGYTPERAGTLSRTLSRYLKPSRYQVDPLATQTVVKVAYVFEVTVSGTVNGVVRSWQELREGELVIPVDDEVDESDFYQAMYRYTDDAGSERVEFWTYEDGSGEYPEIDGIFLGDYSEAGSYFPFVYFRYGSQDLTHQSFRDTDEYRTSKRTLQYLGIDYAALGESISANPDIGSVTQAFTLLAASAETSSPVEQRYLYEYFRLLHLASAGNDDPYTFSRPGRAIKIQDRRLAVGFNYTALSRRRHAGKVNSPSGYSSGSASEIVTESYQLSPRERGTRMVPLPYLYYRKQVSDSHYDEIRVYNPYMVYYIAGKYLTVGGIGSKNLLVPLDKAISDNLPATLREELYLRSLHLVFNTFQITYTKWYQSGWFKIVMIVVAVAIVVFTGGTGAGLVAAFKAGLAAFAWAVASMVVEALVVQVAFKLIAKAVGPELTLLVALVAAAYGMYRGVQAGGLSESVTAQRLLKASTGLIDAASNENTLRLASAYNKDLAEFELLRDRHTEEMKRWEKLLEHNSLIDPFEFVGMEPLTVFGETPGDYFNRTVHAGNVGVRSLDSISYFVDISLTLPRLHDSIGGDYS